MTTTASVQVRRNVDPRGVWMRGNIRSKPFDTGRFAGVPMNALRIATIVANSKVEGRS